MLANKIKVIDSVALWFDDESERVERITKRNLRDRSDIFSLDFSLTQNFPLQKEAFVYVVNAIQHELKIPGRFTTNPAIIKQ